MIARLGNRPQISHRCWAFARDASVHVPRACLLSAGKDVCVNRRTTAYKSSTRTAGGGVLGVDLARFRAQKRRCARSAISLAMASDAVAAGDGALGPGKARP